MTDIKVTTPAAWAANNSHTRAAWNTDFDNGKAALQWFIAQLNDQIASEKDENKKTALKQTKTKVSDILALDDNNGNLLKLIGAHGKRIAGGGWHDGTVNIKSEDGAAELYGEINRLVKPDAASQTQEDAQKAQVEAQKIQADFTKNNKPKIEELMKRELELKEKELQLKELQMKKALEEAQGAGEKHGAADLNPLKPAAPGSDVLGPDFEKQMAAFSKMFGSMLGNGGGFGFGDNSEFGFDKIFATEERKSNLKVYA